MTGIPPLGPRDPREQLRRAAHQLEGVFLAQMFRAMRAAVPEGEATPGRELFTSLLDESLAQQAAERATNGLGEALFRQLIRKLPGKE